jgi:hypothetical protein
MYDSLRNSQLTAIKKSGVFLLPTQKPITTHEQQVHEILGKKIAALMSTSFLGTYKSSEKTGDYFYFIPNDTLVDDLESRALGIRSTDDFFGGVVSHGFMATKAITHPLFDKDAQAPNGWTSKFPQKVSGVVLNGYSVFSLNDARRAAINLLASGTVRIKSVRACAGRGQFVVTTREELIALLAVLDEDEITHWGLVIEENLRQVETYSVGQISISNITASYVGTQSLTRDNNGETVYGGSNLVLTRGNYDALLRLNLSEKSRLAIAQARVYEDAAIATLPGFMASRCNYDIAQGINADGEFCSGVLEQSWRIGGASAAEIFALEAFAADASLKSVRASTHEIYGATEPPARAHILYRGEDAEVGLITKYVKMEPYGYTDPKH